MKSKILSINEYYAIVNLHDLWDSTSTKLCFTMVSTPTNKVNANPFHKELPSDLENTTTI